VLRQDVFLADNVERNVMRENQSVRDVNAMVFPVLGSLVPLRVGHH